MSVIEVVSGHGATATLLARRPSDGGRLVVAKVTNPEDTGRLPRNGADLAICVGNVVAWELELGALSHLRALLGALKPGGILGVVENRAADGRTFRQMMESRAVSEEHVIALAEVAGFRLVARSEVNAARSPSLMTLKFAKPP